jgi:hypothetical protein
LRDRMPVYSMCGWYYDHDVDLSDYKRQITTAMEQRTRPETKKRLRA